jgi:hypothetical protein
MGYLAEAPGPILLMTPGPETRPTPATYPVGPIVTVSATRLSRP